MKKIFGNTTSVASACLLLTFVQISLYGQEVLFDFDNAPIHTPLPVAVSAGGITALLKGTGQSFSIQAANVLGFTPQGFSGLVVYPNSVYQADLLIRFDTPLIDFSIMYACQELGCDDAATMRMTAYRKGILVDTNTKTAANPGTWPVDVLRGNFGQPFDSVMVHYDKRPPTCQDYGVIFMADNMKVTPWAPAVVQSCPPAANQSLQCNLTGTLYQWQGAAAGGSFANLGDNATYQGTKTGTLHITNLPSSMAGTRYRCVVNGLFDNYYEMQFANAWTGMADSSWENPANWSCSVLPDSYTDVLIPGGTDRPPEINTQASCRSLVLEPGAMVTVKDGKKLNLTGRQ